MALHFPADRYPELERFLRKMLVNETPFVPGGRNVQDGLDCAGLIIAAFEHLGAALQYEDNSRPSHWYLGSMAEEEYLDEIRKSFEVHEPPLRYDPEAGDLILFRWQSAGPVAHAGFMLENGEVVSIWDGSIARAHRIETRFWQEKFAGWAAPRPEVWAEVTA